MEGARLEHLRASSHWKGMDSPSAGCASGSRAASSPAGGKTEFTSIYHQWAHRCVEIRESTKEDHFGWAYTLRVYRTDREGSTTKVSSALKAYATTEVQFTGPKLKAILLDVAGREDPLGVERAAASHGNIIPADRIYVRTVDDQVFHLPSSLHLLRVAGCKVIKDSKALIETPTP